MFFGKCRQETPPDSPKLRVRTPSKSHATALDMTLLLAKSLDIYELQNHVIFLMQTTLKNTKYSRNDKILKTRENEKRCSLGKRLTNTFNVKKRSHFAKALVR